MVAEDRGSHLTLKPPPYTAPHLHAGPSGLFEVFEYEAQGALLNKHPAEVKEGHARRHQNAMMSRGFRAVTRPSPQLPADSRGLENEGSASTRCSLPLPHCLLSYREQHRHSEKPPARDAGYTAYSPKLCKDFCQKAMSPRSRTGTWQHSAQKESSRIRLHSPRHNRSTVLCKALFLPRTASCFKSIRCQRSMPKTPWFLVGNGGMDPYDSPLRSPIGVPITHSPISY